MADLQQQTPNPNHNPTADEAIKWITDSMLAAGMIGFSDEYTAPEELAKGWTIGPADEEPQEIPGSALEMDRLLKESDAQEKLMDERLRFINGNKVLRNEAKQEIRRRLFEGGMSESDIQEKLGASPTILTMMQCLYEVQTPKTTAAKTISCQIRTGLPGTVDLVPVKLPVDASFETINDLLRDFVSSELLCASAKGVSKEELENIISAWRYQLIVEKPNGRFAHKVKTRVPLTHDADYREMVREVMDAGKQVLIPLITPVNTNLEPTPNLSDLTMSGESSAAKSRHQDGVAGWCRTEYNWQGQRKC